jgi:spore coat protein U-like protein
MRLTALVLAVAALSAVGTASAATSTGTFQVTASVANSCVVTAANNIAFGAYDPANTNNTTALDGAGSVTVRCTRGSNAAIALDQGLAAAGASSCTTPLRQMSDGGTSRLRYDLYSDSGRSTTWGCATTNDVDHLFTSLAPVTFDTFGRVPAGQDVPAGSYADTVTVTVTF